MNSNSASTSSRSLVGWGVIFLITLLLIGIAARTFHHAERRSFPVEPPIGVVPDFSFVTQEGKKFTKADLAGKIWIADFIFTRCMGPCPMLTARMVDLASKLSKNRDVKLVSVTVDPEHDTPEVLARYAAAIHADPTQWIFLTGTLPEIISFTQKGMKQALAIEPEGTPAHSTRLVVVDGEGMMRNYYDGNDPEVVQKVLTEVGNLLREHSQQAK